MSKKLYEESNIQGIASAIREKIGSSDTYTTAQMAEAIRNIETQPDLEELSASENGTYTPSSGKDGFSRVNVNVQSGGGSAILVQKTITANGTYNALLDDNADGYSEVSVAVDSGGTASFDNILVGSTDPDASIGTPGDMYIKTLVNRVGNHAYHRFLKAFYKSSQNVWSDAPDTTLPYPMVPIRIVTHSAGGNDASIDVYINEVLYTTILYSNLGNNHGHYFENIYGLFIGYGTSSGYTPDHKSRNGWCIYPPSGGSVELDGEVISNPTLIREWKYNINVDFTLLV